MSSMLRSIKQDKTFCVSFIAAAISCCFVPPTLSYFNYIDFRTLALLYSLMLIVAGMRSAGAFDLLAYRLCAMSRSIRSLGFMLTALCFLTSMLITNDVAILTFVPLAITALSNNKKSLAWVVVLQIAAANLGSMLTPVGNPQNIYLYSYYNMTAAAFFSLTIPVWLASAAALIGLCMALPKNGAVFSPTKSLIYDKRSFVFYSVLFLVCALVVFRTLEWQYMLLIVFVSIYFFDKKMLLKVDFLLLLTFVCFFIFSGNIAKINYIDKLIRSILSGHEMLASAAVSQLISNVPTAILLSGFSENAGSLLLGVNIGGLGTPIASLASLIGLKLYSRNGKTSTAYFLRLFFAVNFLLLVLLLPVGFLILFRK